MFRIAFALLTIIQSIAQTATQDDLRDALAHAETLYYGARFNESIELLTRVDSALGSQPGRLRDKIDAKLQLALAHIGLNDTATAKTYLIELYALDPDFDLDRDKFSPKVLAVAAEASAENSKRRCDASEKEARGYLEGGKPTAVYEMVRSLKTKCDGL